MPSILSMHAFWMIPALVPGSVSGATREWHTGVEITWGASRIDHGGQTTARLKTEPKAN
jgi:hypothetical protein